jgi:hypothetical protein
MMMVCPSTTMRSSSRRFTCGPQGQGTPEETHEIVTGTTRAHTSSPRTLPGNTDHADIVHLPDTRGAGSPFAWVDLKSTTQDRFATVTHDPHVSLLTGDAHTAGGTR